MGKFSDWLASAFQPTRRNAHQPAARNIQQAATRTAPANAVQAPYRPGPPARVVTPDWTAAVPTLRPEGRSSVVGESHHQAELHRHLSAVQPHRYVMAQLVRDRDNPHHSGAVAVFVGADHMGYLPRDLLYHGGQSLYQALARLDRRNLPATCWARLTGGTADRPNIGITLSTECDNKPDEPHPFPVTLPPGDWAPVRGVESRQELLGQLLGRRYEARVGCELTPTEENGLRVLDVAVGGTRIGRLSPKDTGARLGLVEPLLAGGRPLHALARIRPSQGKRVKYICSVSVDPVIGH